MRSLIVLLESNAPSFCYYESAPKEKSQPMSAGVFKETVEYAKKRELSLNLISGAGGLDPDYRKTMEQLEVSYVLYLPAGGSTSGIHRGDLPNCVPVVNAWEPGAVEKVEPGVHLTAVLRVREQDLEQLPKVWKQLAGRVYRVVLVVLGLEQFGLKSIALYEQAMETISVSLGEFYLSGKQIELNGISDRMALSKPSHCSAGIDHVTVDPMGRLHICPGFDARGEPSIGYLSSGPVIPNEQLLDRDHAPLCSICDAYQCRRCVNINQLSTLEVNTPPWQLCRTAHVEREAARNLLSNLHSKGLLKGFPKIPSIKYCDPLDPFLNMKKRIAPPRIDSTKKKATSKNLPKEMTEQTARHPKRLGTGSLILTKELFEQSPVGQVSVNESEEIRALHLRRVALGDLFLGLASREAREIASETLYDDIIMDMGRVSIAFQDWWNRVSEKYEWTSDETTRWRIQFESRQVFIEDGKDLG